MCERNATNESKGRGWPDTTRTRAGMVVRCGTIRGRHRPVSHILIVRTGRLWPPALAIGKRGVGRTACGQGVCAHHGWAVRALDVHIEGSLAVGAPRWCGIGPAVSSSMVRSAGNCRAHAMQTSMRRHWATRRPLAGRAKKGTPARSGGSCDLCAHCNMPGLPSARTLARLNAALRTAARGWLSMCAHRRIRRWASSRWGWRW